MHLIDTAYGDIADFLLGLIRGKVEKVVSAATRKCLESVVSRSLAYPVQCPVAGWLLGATRAAPGAVASRGGKVSAAAEEALQAHQRAGNGGRWAPY